MKDGDVQAWLEGVGLDQALPKRSKEIAIALSMYFMFNKFDVSMDDLIFTMGLTLDQTEQAMATLIVRGHVRVKFIQGIAESTPISRRTEA